MTAGFPEAEYRSRLGRAQTRMEEANLSALLITTEADLRYFTGFLTRFWESPTRPWFLVLPAKGDPVAVIPSIGEVLMRKTWVGDIRTWSSPDPVDDGVTLLNSTLQEILGTTGRVGLPSGPESHLRMPLANFQRLKDELGEQRIAGDAGIVADLRAIKSPLEVEKIRTACQIAGRAFDRVGEVAAAGIPLSTVFRDFQSLCLEEGADWVPYLAGGAGQGGYEDVISPADETPLAEGDVLMLDTGLMRDGYFCDFDRNFAIGRASQTAQDSYKRLIEATEAGFEAARPRTTMADLFHTMQPFLGGGSDAGRLGHGLGMQLTEGASIIPKDHTVLQPGMVLTLEPSLPISTTGLLVHEENIVITEGGAEYLSPKAPPELPVLV